MILALLACTTDKYCREVDVVELGDDEATPFGFTPADVLAGVEGAHVASFIREDGSATDTTVTVTRDEGPAVFRTWELAERLKPGLGTDYDLVTCSDGALEIPAAVEIATADGDVSFAEVGYAGAGDDGPDVAWAGGTWPAGEVEGVPALGDTTPDEAFADFSFDGGTLAWGRLGWQGADADSSWARYLLTFGE
jgi:hypothetical protein